MNAPIINPWQRELPKPVNPADAETVRVKAILNDARISARKLDFAKLLFERPDESPLRLLQILFPSPNDTATCLALAVAWPDDPEVIRQLDLLRRPGNTPNDVLPDKDALAMRLIQIADNPDNDATTRLKALAQYQTLMGYDPPKVPTGTNVNVNLVQERRVFVLPNNLSPEDWERKNDPTVTTLELTANDNTT